MQHRHTHTHTDTHTHTEAQYILTGVGFYIGVGTVKNDIPIVRRVSVRSKDLPLVSKHLSLVERVQAAKVARNRLPEPLMVKPIQGAILDHAVFEEHLSERLGPDPALRAWAFWNQHRARSRGEVARVRNDLRDREDAAAQPQHEEGPAYPHDSQLSLQIHLRETRMHTTAALGRRVDVRAAVRERQREFVSCMASTGGPPTAPHHARIASTSAWAVSAIQRSRHRRGNQLFCSETK